MNGDKLRTTLNCLWWWFSNKLATEVQETVSWSMSLAFNSIPHSFEISARDTFSGSPCNAYHKHDRICLKRSWIIQHLTIAIIMVSSYIAQYPGSKLAQGTSHYYPNQYPVLSRTYSKVYSQDAAHYQRNRSARYPFNTWMRWGNWGDDIPRVSRGQQG
jgi:hypothetical protein